MSLKNLKGKFVRYWLTQDENDTCSFGRLLKYDESGVLFGSEEAKDDALEGCQWFPLSQIYSVSYYESDEQEFKDSLKMVEEQSNGKDKSPKSK